MEKLIKVWVELITTFQKDIDDIPAKIKSAVIAELNKVGFIAQENLADVISAKVTEMSMACNLMILNGIDVQLADGNTYHFSLDITDQTMIMKLNERAVAGNEFLPWHWDNGSCHIFSAEDIIAINTQMENYITFHTTYFNSLRDYIKSLTDIEDVMAIEYGVEIPVEYQSEVLKILYQQMNPETSD